MSMAVKWTLVVVAGLAALSGVCCVGSLALGLLVDDGTATGGASPRGVSGAGFTFAPPATFQAKGAGRWRRELADGDELMWVEVSRLPALDGLDGPEAKFAALWSRHVVPQFRPLPIHDRIPTPILQRRFVQNGARAHWGRGRVLRTDTGEAAFVSVYLVEADDRLEPFLVVQGAESRSIGASRFIDMTFSRTHDFVEDLLKGVSGSPTGVPLVDDDEVVGVRKLGDASMAQWVNTATGAETMTGVVRAVTYTFEDDHTFRYQYTGGSGQMGAMQVGSQSDEGTWQVEHDVLVLDGEQFDQRYFISGATVGPEGQQVLLLQPKPHWSLAPDTPFEVYVRQ